MAINTLTDLLAGAAVGTAVAIALLGLIYFALRNSVGTVALLLGVWIVTVALRDSVDLSVTLSGTRTSALDVLSVVIAVVGVVRALSYGIRGMGLGLALVLLLLLAVHVTRGLAEFGVQLSVNAARDWLYFTGALVYAATVPGGWDRRAWRVLAAGGAVLAVVAVPYFVVDGVGSATEFIYRNGELVPSRPIVAAGALLILQTGILALTLRWPSRRTAGYVALGAGASTLLLQHRTLWVAAVVIAIIGFVWWAPRQSRDRVLAATAAMLVALPIAVWGFSQTGSLGESAREPTRNNSTLVWRTDGWDQLISTHDSAAQLAAGNPSGNELGRVLNGTVVDVSPHNGFVDAFLRFGLPGVLIFSALGLLLWFRRSGVAARVGLTGQAVGLLLLTQLVFSMTYSLDLIQGAIAGILVSGLVSARPVRRRVGASESPWHTPPRGYAIR
jgi:hypothetical protein